MVHTIRNYSSLNEIAETLDNEISETKSKLGESLRELDNLRTLAEKSKKIRETVMKMAGMKNGANDNSGEVDIGNLKIILDANPVQQLTAIESVVRSRQERLMVLQKAREGLKLLDQLGDAEGLNLIVLENDGIPERVLIKTS
jgi:hypothetical protein